MNKSFPLCAAPAAAALLVSCLLLISHAAARAAPSIEITVCPAGCDYTDIQSAVDAARDNDLIRVMAGVYSGDVAIDKSVTIQGTGAALTLVDAAGQGRGFTILGDPVVTLAELTLANGAAPADTDLHARGGGIYNEGDLTLRRVTVRDSVAQGAALDGVSGEGQGGGIYNGCRSDRCATLVISSSQVSDNRAVGGAAPEWGYAGGAGRGGGIFNIGRLEMTASLVAGNLVYQGENTTGYTIFGAGIYNGCAAVRCGALLGAGLVISGNQARGDRMYTGANAYGGGLYNSGGPVSATVTLTESVILDNLAEGGEAGTPFDAHGGGVFNNGSFIMSGGIISGNEVIQGVLGPYDSGSSYGGGIDNRQRLFLSGVDVARNYANFGAGLYTVGYADISYSRVISNHGTEGAGIYAHAAADVNILDSALVANRAQVGSGSFGCAGVNNWGAFTGELLTVADNLLQASTSAPGSLSGGGAGLCNVGMMTLTQSTIAKNRIEVSVSSVYSGTVDVFAAGIHNERLLSLFDSAVIYNAITVTGPLMDNSSIKLSGGGIFNAAGSLAVRNSTISGNSLYGEDEGSVALGAGLYLQETATLRQATISANRARGGIAGGGGIWVSTGAPEISGSIVAANIGGDCAGALISLGYNLGGDGDCPFTATGDMLGLEPLFGELKDNGGPTWTHAILADSPAVDAGHPLSCPAFDQRGVPRPQDGNGDGTARCDIGAYEVGLFPPVWWRFLPGVWRG